MQQAEILREPASETRVKSNRHATLFLTVSALLVLCSLCMPSLFTAGDITNRTDRAACAKAFRKSGCCPPLPAARKDRHPCRSLRGESAHQDRMRLPGAALPPSKLVAKAARSGEALMGGTRLPGSPPGAAASHSAVAITGRPISHNQNPKITAAPYEARGLHALSIEGCILKLCNHSSASLQHWPIINCRHTDQVQYDTDRQRGTEHEAAGPCKARALPAEAFEPGPRHSLSLQPVPQHDSGDVCRCCRSRSIGGSRGCRRLRRVRERA